MDVNQPSGRALQGTLDEHEITSDALADDPLGDPPNRPLWVLTPTTGMTPEASAQWMDHWALARGS